MCLLQLIGAYRRGLAGAFPLSVVLKNTTTIVKNIKRPNDQDSPVARSKQNRGAVVTCYAPTQCPVYLSSSKQSSDATSDCLRDMACALTYGMSCTKSTSI